MVETHVKVCKELVDNGGDWERRSVKAASSSCVLGQLICLLLIEIA